MPSTLTRIFAAWRASRSSDTSLMASAVQVLPALSRAVISSGWSVTFWARAGGVEDAVAWGGLAFAGGGKRAKAARAGWGGGGKKGAVRAPPPGGAGTGPAPPPVTLMWRDTAGRLWRRSMMKSWPLGLRA